MRFMYTVKISGVPVQVDSTMLENMLDTDAPSVIASIDQEIGAAVDALTE